MRGFHSAHAVRIQARGEKEERSSMSSAAHCLTISQNPDYEASARDEELLHALRGDSHVAFAELQKTYSDRVYKRILSITRNREDAEDALQDAFLHAYLALPSFEGRAKLSTWLTRIGINSALMILRRRRRRPETSFEQPLGSEEGIAPFDVPDSRLNPEQLCDQRQRLSAILRTVEGLDSKSRAAIHFAALQEHSMKDVAESLGVSQASVKARLHRARKRLLRSPALRTRKLVHSSDKRRMEPLLS
jgi:RNA polymerase sigma-70 factor, ECF subfamily